jgi:predicted Na+-dependent transporter
MQSSALAGVLARLHFTDPAVVAPCVCSAVVMCTLGSMLSGYWSITVKDGE